MKIHHIGYAIVDINKSIREFSKLGYNLIGEVVNDEERNILIQFMENGGYVIELIAKDIKSKYSPIDEILRKNKGANPYHFCYVTENIVEKITELSQNGFILIEKEKESKAIQFKKVAFLYSKAIGIIELVEK